MSSGFVSSDAGAEQDGWDIIVQQPTLADYRRLLFRTLAAALEPEHRLMLLFGASSMKKGVAPSKLERDLGFTWRQVRNLSVAGFMLQVGSCLPCMRGRLSVLNINPRNLSVWLILVTRAALRRKNVAWGHLFSLSGPGAFGNVLRFLQMRLCSSVMLYSEREVGSFPGGWRASLRLVGLQNSSVSEEAMMVPVANGDRHDLLYVGRLEADKNVGALVQWFASARCRISAVNRLVLVGDGSLAKGLREQYSKEVAEGVIVFTGWIWDTPGLRTAYATARASICPGYGGLNIIQSHAFGVPVLYPRDIWHSPEIAACVEGVNSFSYSWLNPRELETALEAIESLDRRGNDFRNRIVAKAKLEWSIENMCHRMAGHLRSELLAETATVI